MTTVTRLFDSHTEALRALDELEQAGVSPDDISLVSNNADNWHAGHRHHERKDRHDAGTSHARGPLGDRNGDGENDVAEGAGVGATTGGLIGGGAGLLAGLGMLAIPGLGPVVAAGWLASTAVGAAVGAAAGGAAGGLLGALKEAGHTDEEANVYSEGVRRGGTLVSVRVDESEVERIQAILDSQHGVDALTRGAAYREAGWNGFDPDAQPYSVEEVYRERRLYGEVRSFADDDPASIPDEGLTGDTDRYRPTPTPGATRDF